MTITNLKNHILKKTREALRKSGYETKIKLQLTTPPALEQGDFTIACFSLAQTLKQDPSSLAQKIASHLKPDRVIEQIKAEGPYLNFFLSPPLLFKTVIKEILKKQERFGNSQKEKGKLIMLEYLSPNTNKPLHLGHLRNGALGMAMAKILEAQGARVIKTSLINDRGVHICKSMLAYQLWGKDRAPQDLKMKPDHFVGHWYVKYAQAEKKDPLLKKNLQKMLKKWEEGDRKIRNLWKKMNEWFYQGFTQTYQDFNLKFDKFYYESKTYQLGKKIVKKGLKRGIFYYDKKGSVVFNLPAKEFGVDAKDKEKKALLLRRDGTSVYLTQDLGTTVLRMQEYPLNQLIFVVGDEQEYYFKSLFAILRALEYKWAQDLFHLSYAMVYLPQGKMKSRAGQVVDADDLLHKMKQLAQREIEKRYKKENLSALELQRRTEKISRGAVKFFLLRVNPQRDIHFNPQESISFEGFTGPYIQYAYARCQGILRKANKAKLSLTPAKLTFNLKTREAHKITHLLLDFPQILCRAREEYNPARIALFSYQLAKAFHQFYQTNPILSLKDTQLKQSRLLLVQAIALLLKKALSLLDMEVLERM